MSEDTGRPLTRDDIDRAIDGLTMGDVAAAYAEGVPDAQVGFLAFRRALKRLGLTNGSVEDPLDAIRMSDLRYTGDKLQEAMAGASPKSPDLKLPPPSVTSGE
jgi:hypothetical protein